MGSIAVVVGDWDEVGEGRGRGESEISIPSDLGSAGAQKITPHLLSIRGSILSLIINCHFECGDVLF
jgi:hypothetical protein